MILADDTTTVAIVTSIPATIAAIASLTAVLIGRNNKQRGEATHATVTEIDKAVNGAQPGDDSIRENVQTLINRGE
jgi:hypothetical protein